MDLLACYGDDSSSGSGSESEEVVVKEVVEEEVEEESALVRGGGGGGGLFAALPAPSKSGKVGLGLPAVKRKRKRDTKSVLQRLAAKKLAPALEEAGEDEEEEEEEEQEQEQEEARAETSNEPEQPLKQETSSSSLVLPTSSSPRKRAKIEEVKPAEEVKHEAAMETPADVLDGDAPLPPPPGISAPGAYANPVGGGWRSYAQHLQHQQHQQQPTPEALPSNDPELLRALQRGNVQIHDVNQSDLLQKGPIEQMEERVAAEIAAMQEGKPLAKGAVRRIGGVQVANQRPTRLLRSKGQITAVAAAAAANEAIILRNKLEGRKRKAQTRSKYGW